MPKFKPCKKCGSTNLRTVIKKKQYICMSCKRLRTIVTRRMGKKVRYAI